MDKYKKLATNTIIMALGKFSSTVLSFLLMPFVTSILVTGEYGAADLIQQTANVIIPIAFLQINSAVLRFALDKDADKRNVFTIGIRVTLIGFIVFLAFAYPISLITINDFNLGEYILLIYSFVFISGCRQLCQQFVRGCEHIKTYTLDGLIATATTLLFNLLFLGVFKWGIYGYILAILASDACSIIFLFASCKLWQYVSFSRLDRSLTKQMLKYSVPMMPSIILWWIINVSDRYMVTYFIDQSANGLYTAASKIPNFIILFSTIFCEAWQLSAVDEYDSDSKATFFTNVFRVYSGGVFVAASGLIIACQLFTKILVADMYYDSWKYVPILIISTTLSCFVNFLASVYMASKKTFMSMLTALAGAVTNFVLNIILIPRMGANGATIATVCAFIVVFVLRAINTRQYVRISFKPVIITIEIAILALQSVIMIGYESGVLMYGIECALFLAMLVFNIKPVKELCELLIGKFLKRGKKNNS